MYVSMAHTVAKELHIRPNTILDEWGVPELIVAYGYYTDLMSSQNYEQWKSLDPKSRGKMKQPSKFHVKFIGMDEVSDG